MSDKKVTEMLRLKAGESLYAVNVPNEVWALLYLQAGVADGVPEQASVIIVFAQDRQEMLRSLVPLSKKMGMGARLWVAYPRRRRHGPPTSIGTSSWPGLPSKVCGRWRTLPLTTHGRRSGW